MVHVLNKISSDTAAHYTLIFVRPFYGHAIAYYFPYFMWFSPTPHL